MSLTGFTPPYASAAHLDETLAEQGHVVLSPHGVCELAGCTELALDALAPSWNDLPPDDYLKDGGRYRRRRHANYVVRGDEVQLAPHRAHWQPVAYNALHGGMQRWFAPVDAAVAAHSAWVALLRWTASVASALRGAQDWYVEAHQFRIDTTDGIGRPTPEGAHRDGVDLVAVFLVARHDIKGGETRVFEAQGPNGRRFTLTQPWSVLLLDDERVIHESTPIQPDGANPYRDTLVLTLRARGFQGEDGLT
jgi:hypothetical protein